MNRVTNSKLGKKRKGATTNPIADKESLIGRSCEPTPLPEGKVPVVVPEPSFEA